MSDVTELKKPSIRIFDGDLQEADYARPVYILKAKAGTTAEDYAQPETYAHVGGKLKPHTRLEILAEDNTWFATAIVLTVSPLVRVEILSKHSFETDAAAVHEGYNAKWAGQHAKWRVVRKSDQNVMVDKLESKSEAVAWIEENAKPALKAA